MLVTHVTALVVLIVMMTRLIMVRMVVVLLIFRHLHPISLMVLSPVHHDVLALLSVVVVHVEGVVRRRGVHRRSRGRRGVVCVWSSSPGGRCGAMDVSVVVVLVVLRIVELPRPRLLKPECTTICHLGWPR